MNGTINLPLFQPPADIINSTVVTQSEAYSLIFKTGKTVTVRATIELICSNVTSNLYAPTINIFVNGVIVASQSFSNLSANNTPNSFNTVFSNIAVPPWSTLSAKISIFGGWTVKVNVGSVTVQ